MLSQIFYASALVLSVIAIPAPLPPCSFKTIHKPCACPNGTYFVNSTTWAVIGANTKAVAKITDNCSYFLLRIEMVTQSLCFLTLP